jgi:hypothetical protein
VCVKGFARGKVEIEKSGEGDEGGLEVIAL